MVIFRPKGGDMYIEELFNTFLVRGGEIDRDLYNKLEVNMKNGEESAKFRNLRL